MTIAMPMPRIGRRCGAKKVDHVPPIKIPTHAIAIRSKVVCHDLSVLNLKDFIELY
jgi:hypothetical protein